MKKQNAQNSQNYLSNNKTLLEVSSSQISCYTTELLSKRYHSTGIKKTDSPISGIERVPTPRHTFLKPLIFKEMIYIREK